MFRNPATDVIVVLVIVLLIFGPKRLPSLGKSLGHGIREFKDGITGNSTVDDEGRPALNAAQTTQPVSSPQAAPAPPPAETAPAPSSPPQQESAEAGSTEQRA